MANPFATGRTRTCTMGGNWAALYAEQQDIEPVPDPDASHGAWGTITLTNGVGSFAQIQPAPNTGCTSPEIFGGVLLTVGDGLGATNSSTTGICYRKTDGPGIVSSWEIDGSGSYSLSCDVKEYCEVYLLDSALTTTINGSAFPSFAGTGYGDGRAAYGVRFYEVTRIGGNIVCSASFSGASASVTTAITSEVVVGYTQQASASYYSYLGYLIPFSGNCSFTMGSNINLPSESWTGGHTGGNPATATVTIGGRSVTVATSGGEVDNPSQVTLSIAAQPATSYTYNGRIRCFGKPYPRVVTGTLLWKYLANTSLTYNPNTSCAWTQNAYSIAATVNDPSFSASLAEVGPIRTSLDTASLASLGEDARDWRLCFSGFSWPALALSRASSLVLDSCISLTNWTAGANTTLSLVDGYLFASASGGVGALTLSVPSAVQVWEIYRYLSIDCYGSEPFALGLGMAGQNWSVSVEDTPITLTVDLACATGDTETVDTTQSRFPIASPGGYPTATLPTNAYKMGWGVNYCSTLTIVGIPDGQSLSLGGVSLVSFPSATDRQAAVTLLEGFLNFVPGWTGTTVQPYLLLESDWRAMDVPALCLVSGSGYVWYTISQIQTILAYFPGLTATLLTAPSDGYHGAGLEGLLLGGEGATYDWSGGGWTDWVDVALPVTLPAQDLFDEFQGYPEMGQVWTGGGAYGGPTPLQVSKSLRGAADGLVFLANTGKPYNHAEVNAFLTSTPTTIYGTATTGPLQGEYLTGAPWGPGNQDITTQLHQGDLPYLSSHSVWANRLRTRSSFRLPPTIGLGTGYDVSQSLRHVRCFSRSTTGHLYLGVAQNASPVVFSDVDTGISGTWGRPRFLDCGTSRYIGMLYGDGTTVYWARTFDEGTTWVDTASLGDGTVGDYEEGANGVKWMFKVQDDSGVYNVYGRVLDNQLNVLRDWTITNLTGVDNEPIACRESIDTTVAASWRIGVMYSVSGSILVGYSSDGLTFA